MSYFVSDYTSLFVEPRAFDTLTEAEDYAVYIMEMRADRGYRWTRCEYDMYSSGMTEEVTLFEYSDFPARGTCTIWVRITKRAKHGQT